jgi:hypothetical protein
MPNTITPKKRNKRTKLAISCLQEMHLLTTTNIGLKQKDGKRFSKQNDHKSRREVAFI